MGEKSQEEDTAVRLSRFINYSARNSAGRTEYIYMYPDISVFRALNHKYCFILKKKILVTPVRLFKIICELFT